MAGNAGGFLFRRAEDCVNMALTGPDEFGLIGKYFAGLTPGGRGVLCGVGDDAAIVRAGADAELVIATDSLVAGVHFFPDAAPVDVGYKALAVNLSDVAAMGATPRWITLALVLPPDALTGSWLSGFSRGLGELARAHGVALVGGDLCAGPLTVTVQVIGECPAGQALRRCGAAVGDLIYVSGALGGAAGALALLKSGCEDVPAGLSERLRRPVPRVELGQALRGIASAAIDISDGLLADLRHLLAAGGMGARVDMQALPLDERLRDARFTKDKWRFALSGGDDYELCFTVPKAKVETLERAGLVVHRIGEVTAQPGVRCLLPDGSRYQPDRAGYQHFRR